MQTEPSTSLCAAFTGITLPAQFYAKRSARVEKLLRNNHAPLDIELSHFRAVVDHSSTILDELEKKMAHTQRILDELSESHSLVEAHLAGAKTIIHPMRSVPNDVLGEIFRHCVPVWDHSRSEGDSLNPAHAPWTISQVCQRWRDLALNTPSLWTYFELNFDAYSNIPSRQCAYKAGLYLGRSRHLSLDVAIYDYSWNMDEEFAILPILELSVHRWKRVDLKRSSYLLEYFSGNLFPRLSRLDISAYGDDVHRYEGDPINTIKAATSPSLKRIGVSSWLIYNRISIPWSQITHLDVHADFERISWKFLDQMTRLEHLSATFSVRLSVPSAVHLPRLISVDLRLHEGLSPAGSNFARIDEFITVLRAPLLSHMSLSFPRSRIHPACYPKCSSVLASVTNLTIETNTGDHADNTRNLLAFLSRVPQVREFRLCDGTTSKEMIQGMQATTSINVLPRLRRLDLSECFYDSTSSLEDINIWWLMLQSRSFFPVASDDKGTSVDNRIAHAPWTPLYSAVLPRWMYSDEDKRWDRIRSVLRLESGVAS